MINPYLDEYARLLRGLGYDGEMESVETGNSLRLHLRYNEGWARRIDFVKKYAWAIPGPKALEEIKKYSPIIEIGAGAGYWKMCLESVITSFK